jgi:hypothetical protein
MYTTIPLHCSPAGTCCPSVAVLESGVAIKDVCEDKPDQTVILSDAQLVEAVRAWASARSQNLNGRTPVIRLLGDLADIVCTAVNAQLAMVGA